MESGAPSERALAAARASGRRRPRVSGPPPRRARAQTFPHAFDPEPRGPPGRQPDRDRLAGQRHLGPARPGVRPHPDPLGLLVAALVGDDHADARNASGGVELDPDPRPAALASALTPTPCRAARRRRRTAASPGAPGPGCRRTHATRTPPGAGHPGSAPCVSQRLRHPACSRGPGRPAGPRLRPRGWPTSPSWMRAKFASRRRSPSVRTRLLAVDVVRAHRRRESRARRRAARPRSGPSRSSGPPTTRRLPDATTARCAPLTS